MKPTQHLRMYCILDCTVVAYFLYGEHQPAKQPPSKVTLTIRFEHPFWTSSITQGYTATALLPLLTFELHAAHPVFHCLGPISRHCSCQCKFDIHGFSNGLSPIFGHQKIRKCSFTPAVRRCNKMAVIRCGQQVVRNRLMYVV